MLGSLGAVLAVMVVAVGTGTVHVPPGEILATLGAALRGETLSGSEVIVWQMRLPRVLTAALVGGALALAGAIYQGVFRNPLADPYLLGTASGAGFGATLVAALAGSAPFLAQVGGPITAFVFGLATVLLVAALARDGASLPTVRLILAGVVVGSIFTAATSFLMVVSREQAAGMLARLLGGFGFSGWPDVWIMIAFTLPALLLAGAFARALDLLQLGEEGAALAETVISNAERLERSLASILLGGGLMLFGATTVFAQLQGALNQIWRVEAAPQNALLGFLRHRLLSFALIVSLGFLMMVSLVLSALLAAVQGYLEARGFASVGWWRVLDVAVTFGFAVVLIAMVLTPPAAPGGQQPLVAKGAEDVVDLPEREKR